MKLDEQNVFDLCNTSHNAATACTLIRDVADALRRYNADATTLCKFHDAAALLANIAQTIDAASAVALERVNSQPEESVEDVLASFTSAKNISLQCPTCNGRGAVGAATRLARCPTCNGEGHA